MEVIFTDIALGNASYYFTERVSAHGDFSLYESLSRMLEQHLIVEQLHPRSFSLLRTPLRLDTSRQGMKVVK